MFFIVMTAESPIPLVDKDYALRLFATVEEAQEVAEATLLGKAYGHVIYELEE
jgi:hypothetical protein